MYNKIFKKLGNKLSFGSNEELIDYFEKTKEYIYAIESEKIIQNIDDTVKEYTKFLEEDHSSLLEKDEFFKLDILEELKGKLISQVLELKPFFSENKALKNNNEFLSMEISSAKASAIQRIHKTDVEISSITMAEKVVKSDEGFLEEYKEIQRKRKFLEKIDTTFYFAKQIIDAIENSINSERLKIRK